MQQNQTSKVIFMKEQEQEKEKERIKSIIS